VKALNELTLSGGEVWSGAACAGAGAGADSVDLEVITAIIYVTMFMVSMLAKACSDPPVVACLASRKKRSRF
jgi:hypothetical protein